MVLIAMRTEVRRRERNQRCRKERSVEKAKVSVVASSAVLGTKADDSMLQESLSANVCAARVRTAMEGLPIVP